MNHHYFLLLIYINLLEKIIFYSSVVDPDPYWVWIQWLVDPDPNQDYEESGSWIEQSVSTTLNKI
jgi:hypothetical protein